MVVLWVAGIINLLILFVEDIRAYKVSLVLLLSWISISIALNFPPSIDVLMNISVLLAYFLALELWKYLRKIQFGMGLGDWLFLLGLTFHFSLFQFVLFTLVSNVCAILGVLLIGNLKKGNPHQIFGGTKIPMVSVYALLFIVNQVVVWSN